MLSVTPVFGLSDWLNVYEDGSIISQQIPSFSVTTHAPTESIPISSPIALSFIKLLLLA
jgi:hypothetical protein